MITQFYAKLPKNITDTSARLRKVMESGEVDNAVVVKIYFSNHWVEFKKWWMKNMGEHLDYFTFALAPHNCEFFTAYIFKKYPQVMDQVIHDLDNAGWM